MEVQGAAVLLSTQNVHIFFCKLLPTEIRLRYFAVLMACHPSFTHSKFLAKVFGLNIFIKLLLDYKIVDLKHTTNADINSNNVDTNVLELLFSDPCVSDSPSGFGGGHPRKSTPK